MKAPEGRYRIIERDRRLVTIDTLTGKEIGSGGAQRASPPAMPQPHEVRTESAPPAPSLSALNAGSNAPRPGLQPQAQRPERMPPSSNAQYARPKVGGRVAALMIGAIMLFFFLAMTGLWIFVVVAFLVPQVRQALLPPLGRGLKRFLKMED